MEINIAGYAVTISPRKGSSGIRYSWYCSQVGIGGEGYKATPELAIIDAQTTLNAPECRHGIPATQFCTTCHDLGDATTPTAKAAPKATPTAAQLVAHLRNSGYTARQIATAIGVHVSTVYRWARGAFRPTAARATALLALI